MPRLSKLFILKVNVSGFMISYSGRDIGIIFPLKFKIIHIYNCFKHPTQAAFLTDELCLVACARQIIFRKKLVLQIQDSSLNHSRYRSFWGLFSSLLMNWLISSIILYLLLFLFFSHLEKSMALSRRWCYHMNQWVESLDVKYQSIVFIN